MRYFTGSSCQSSKYAYTQTTSTACASSQQVVCNAGAPTAMPTTVPTVKPSRMPSVKPTRAPQLYSSMPTVEPSEGPTYPTSYHFAPGGYIYVKRFTQTAGCTGYHQLEVYSVDVCQVSGSSSYKYTSVRSPNEDDVVEGTNINIFFIADYITYSDTTCTQPATDEVETFLTTCSNNEVTGIPQTYSHSTYPPTFPTGFMIALVFLLLFGSMVCSNVCFVDYVQDIRVPVSVQHLPSAVRVSGDISVADLFPHNSRRNYKHVLHV